MTRQTNSRKKEIKPAVYVNVKIWKAEEKFPPVRSH